MKKHILIICCLLTMASPYALAQNPDTEIRGDYAPVEEEVRDPALESFIAMEGDMEELDTPDLASLTGQIGVRIDISLEVTDGYLAWKDRDGYTEGGASGDPGCITFAGMKMNDGNDPSGPILINNLMIDTGYTSDGSYFAISLPDIIGRVSFEDVKLGPEPDQGDSLGGLMMGDFFVRQSNFLIRTRF